MKTLFFILLFIPVAAFSQHFAISIDGGISTNSIPSSPIPPDYFGGGVNTKTTGTSFDIKASYFFRKTIEVGVGVNPVSLSYKNTLNFTDTESRGVFKNTYVANTVIGHPAIPVYAFINKKIPLPKGFVYYGFAIGYVYTSAGKSEVESFQEKNEGGINTRYVEYRQVYSSGGGLYTAASLGYARHVVKKLFIYLEGSVKRVALKDSDIGNYSVVYYPLCLGLQYQF